MIVGHEPASFQTAIVQAYGGAARSPEGIGKNFTVTRLGLTP